MTCPHPVSVLVSVGAASEVAERGDQHSGQPELTSLNFLDGVDEGIERRVFPHEPLHPGPDGGALVCHVAKVVGEHDDMGGMAGPDQQWEGIQAALGQILGDQNDVHGLAPSLSHSVGRRGRLVDDPQARPTIEHHAEAGSDNRVGVHEQ